MKTKFSIILILLVFVISGYSQNSTDSTLKLSNAIYVAMQNNYDITIAKNNLRIAENNAGILNSGYLPSVVAGAGGNYSNNNTDMTFASTTGEQNVSQDNAVSKSYNGSLGINYRLFDGMNRHYNYQKLQANFDMSELQSRAIIENVLIQVIRTYYDVARLTSKIENINRTLVISNTRYNYVKDQYFYGVATELDLLNSEVDRNNDSVNYIVAFNELNVAHNNLNVLLGRSVEEDFVVDTTVQFSLKINKPDLLLSAYNRNVDYTISLQSKNISGIEVKQSKSGYYPYLDVNGKYALSQTNNDVGNLLYSHTTGFSTGVSLNWNIFDGGRTRTQVLNSKISLENSEQVTQQSKNELERRVSDAYNKYVNSLFVLKVESKNKQTNELNFSRSKDQFRLGQISSLDFRKAQVDLEGSINGYNEAMYSAKIAEMELLKLAGLFLDEL
ncbi:MAG: TolC family protein [Bacteroidota bacterium]